MATTKKYILENLDCPSCAGAIEREVRDVEGINSATVDLPSTSITVEFDGDESKILEAVTAIAVDVEESIVVKPS
jgi:Cd2+/Zn2+-exporting ATPase